MQRVVLTISQWYWLVRLEAWLLAWPGMDRTMMNEPVTYDSIASEIEHRLDASFALAHLEVINCLLYTSPSPRDQRGSRMPSSA